MVENIRNKGFTFVELIVSIFILSLLIVVAFTSFNIKVHSTANTINELEVQGNVRFAAIFINNLLSDCELKDITIRKGMGGCFTLLIKKTYIYLSGSTLMVQHNYSYGPSNPLANYITRFEVKDDNGLISVILQVG